MPIYNKGRFKLSEIIQPQFGNNWPTAQVTTTSDVVEVSSNLYFTNARVLTALTNSNVQGNITVTGGITANTVTANSFISTGTGVPTLSSATNINLSAGGAAGGAVVIQSSALRLNTYKTSERSSLTPSAGDLIYNSNVATLQLYSTAWKDVLIEGSNANIGNLTATSIVINTSTANSYTTAGNVNAGNVIATALQGNIWTGIYTANVIESASNLYFTNARVYSNVAQMSVNVFADVDITGITTNGILTWNGTSFVAGTLGSVSSANTATFATTANTANTVLSISNFATTNLPEGTNLYYSNARAISAFSSGKGINISGAGVITNTGVSPQYNTTIDGTVGANVLSTMSSVITFPNTSGDDRYLLRSLHLVNISGATALVSSNVLYATGNTAYMANLIPVAPGGVMEFIKTYQIFQPGDQINLQGFNTSGVPTSNLMSAMLTYETFYTDSSYRGVGQTITTSGTNTSIYNSANSFSIIESVKFVNLQTSTIPVTCYWADANGVPKAYLAYGLQLPPNSSIELLQSTKRINQYDSLYANYTGGSTNGVSAFVSARYGTSYSIGTYTSSALPGNTLTTSFSTTANDGTILYYSIE